MHEIEPFYNWEKYYLVAQDERSPFYGKEYDFTQYTNDIYGYYIDPNWDFIGSETLYIKILFADYNRQFVIIEMIGEWNDAIHNDCMHLKRNIIDHLLKQGIKYFILIGENIFNFHGSDDCYYEEWFEDVEDGWIAAINFRDFIFHEWQKYQLDNYINYGGKLDILNWRTMKPVSFYEEVKQLISRRIDLV
jgi:hypothetical protein